jgi:serine/threonine protein kinase
MFPGFTIAGADGGEVTVLRPLRDADPAEAFSAEDAGGRAVAVYRLREGASRCSAHRFIQDAAALARLTREAPHPGVMGVHAMALDRKSFLAEHVDGPTLGDVEHLQLDLDEKLHVLARICDALVAAHAQAIFFGRLRPTSIVLRAPLEPVIAEVPASADCAHEAGGRYAAPEARRGGGVGTRGDVYAFGRLMQFVLGEREPVDEDEQLPALDGMCALPAGLVRITRRCLSTDPATRYRNIASLAADLAQYRQADQVGLRHPAGKERSEPRRIAADARPSGPAGTDAVARAVASASRTAAAARALPDPADGMRRAAAASLVAVLAIGLASLTGPGARRLLGDAIPRAAAETTR